VGSARESSRRVTTIARVEAFPVRLPRSQEAIGTAGSPTPLRPGAHDYRWSDTVAALYSIHFETALVRVETASGVVGWGESQAPLAPEVACAIVNLLLKPVVEGTTFGGDPSEIEELWRRMYATMRVRGHGGGFMLDAISGVDIALWDVAGKMRGQPVSEMMAPGERKPSVPAYLSGLPGDLPSRIDAARRAQSEGFRTSKSSTIGRRTTSGAKRAPSAPRSVRNRASRSMRCGGSRPRTPSRSAASATASAPYGSRRP
jgi:L-alanine-DL-glutamate epimerase-like enolase superfamily enzyme